MSTALVLTTDLMPTVAERAHDLDHMPAHWGLYPAVIPRDPIHREPPTPDVLAVMQDELASGLLPAGKVLAAKYGLVLNESYPQRDQVGDQYPARLVERLAECPADLLQPVCDELLDTMIHRPSAAEVKAAVAKHIARRQLLLLRVQAGLRYWQWQEEQAKTQADALAAAACASLTGALVREMAPPRIPRSSPREMAARAMPQPERPRSKADLRAQAIIDAARSQASR